MTDQEYMLKAAMLARYSFDIPDLTYNYLTEGEKIIFGGPEEFAAYMGKTREIAPAPKPATSLDGV